MNLSIEKIVFRLLLFGFLFTGFYAVAQKNLKYKDVFKVVEEKSREESYSLLLVYQKQDPFFANTYLQLGLLAQYWSKDYDALTNLKDVEFFIYNTNLYYGLALSKIDQKEVRKNEKFYLNIDRFKNREKIEFEEIKSFIQEQIDANNEYNRNVQIVTRLFNSSIKHYHNCIRIFKEINANNYKIKDIYLTANAKFMVDLKELESSFDSTIFYLQNYQTAIKNYPIKKYNQKYKLLPIETYRLHGLTGSDFLKDEIPIWNYGAWVKNVRQVITTDIEDIRNQITKADSKLNENISLLSESREYKTDFEKYNVDDKLKFKIGKFDHQSILLDLFKFKESKIDFLANLKNPVNNPKDTSVHTLVQKSRFYENLIQNKKVCDSLNHILLKNVQPYEINKYYDFITTNYGGEPGLKTYLKNENGFLNSKLKAAFVNFKDFLVKSNINEGRIVDTLMYKQKVIGLQKSKIDFVNAKPDSCYTIDFKENNTGDFYITGYIKEGTNPCFPFVARSNKRNGILWLKIIPSPQLLNSYGIFIQAKDDGCDVLVHTPLDSLGQNQVYHFDFDGKQKDKLDIAVSSHPRYFYLDEINQKYTIVFKGFKQNQLECFDSDLILLNYDVAQKKEMWRQIFKLKGNFVDVLTMNQNHFIVTNFVAYQTDSSLIVSKGGKLPFQTNALVILIDQAGKIVREEALFDEKPYFITNIVKTSSNTVNLLGFRQNLSDIENLKQNSTIELVYLLLDTEGKLYFDNSKLQ